VDFFFETHYILATLEKHSLHIANSTLLFLKIFSLGAIFPPKQTFGDMQPFLFGCQVVCPLKKLLILTLPLRKHKKTQVNFF